MVQTLTNYALGVGGLEAVKEHIDDEQWSGADVLFVLCSAINTRDDELFDVLNKKYELSTNSELLADDMVVCEAATSTPHIARVILNNPVVWSLQYDSYYHPLRASVTPVGTENLVIAIEAMFEHVEPNKRGHFSDIVNFALMTAITVGNNDARDILLSNAHTQGLVHHDKANVLMSLAREPEPHEAVPIEHIKSLEEHADALRIAVRHVHKHKTLETLVDKEELWNSKILMDEPTKHPLHLAALVNANENAKIVLHALDKYVKHSAKLKPIVLKTITTAAELQNAELLVALSKHESTREFFKWSHAFKDLALNAAVHARPNLSLWNEIVYIMKETDNAIDASPEGDNLIDAVSTKPDLLIQIMRLKVFNKREVLLKLPDYYKIAFEAAKDNFALSQNLFKQAEEQSISMVAVEYLKQFKEHGVPAEHRRELAELVKRAEGSDKKMKVKRAAAALAKRLAAKQIRAEKNRMLAAAYETTFVIEKF